MLHAVDPPILLSAFVFLAFAVVDWRRSPTLGRVSLGVAVAFFAAAWTHPGETLAGVIESGDGIAYLAAAARIVGAATGVMSLATRAQDLATR